MDDLNRNIDRDATLSASERQADDLRRGDVNAGDEIGEAVGGISGVLTGAAIGSLGGPIGTIIGGIAGAVSGWWAGKAISDVATNVTRDEDTHYQTHYEGSATRPADRSYEDVRPAYQLGQLAGRNPDYQSRSFDEVEGDLQRGWSDDVTSRHGSWDQVRDYARHAYDRDRASFGTGAVAGAAGTAGLSSGGTGSSLGNTGDRLADKAENAWDKTKAGTENVWDKTKAGAEDAWDKTKAGAENLGHRAANLVDDTKDRIDGNPASKPGPDATDSPRRL